MNKSDLQNLIERNEDQTSPSCPNKQCCEYLRYAQFFNHSYVLCSQFEEYYDKQQRREISQKGNI